MNDRKFFAPEVQTLPREAIRALQEERLRSRIARIFDRPIAFQKRRLEAIGAGPRDIRTLEDLAKIPTVTKDALRES
jgi:phenylacetate-CoA ligase